MCILQTNLLGDVGFRPSMNSGNHSYPINLIASRLIDMGSVLSLFTFGVRYYTVNTNIGGAKGWGGRLGITYAFSK